MTQKNEQEILLTAEGFLELETELNDLKINTRPEVIKALKEARALGDLSENADYDAARDAQAKLEGRIKELEYKLENAKIISNDSKDTVSIGSTVTISYIDDDETEEYKIVGSLEADPFNNKISNESPIGAAIIGKKVNEIVSVETPNGSFDVKIESIA